MLTMDEVRVIERLQLDGFTVTAGDILLASRHVHASKDAPNALDDYTWGDDDGASLREASADTAETSRRWVERLERIVRRAHID